MTPTAPPRLKAAEPIDGAANTEAARTLRANLRPVALMLPAAALTAVLMAIPIITTVVRVISDGGQGLSRLFDLPNIWQVLANTAAWTLLAVVGAMLVGYLGAFVLGSRHLRLIGLWRGLIMIPWIIPGVVGATVWRWSLSTDYGILNALLLRTGVLETPVRWLSEPSVVLWSVALVQVWVTAPFVVLMVSAALSGVPAERIEAARIDGAGELALLWNITLPAIRTTSAICLLTLVIWALNSFTIIWVLTGGGPAGASTILPILLYQAFQRGDETLVYGVALVQLLIGAVFAVLFARTLRTDMEELS